MTAYVDPDRVTFQALDYIDRDGDQLSNPGRARAQALVTALAGDEITWICSPGLPRNRDVAAPLAADCDLKIKRRPLEALTQRVMREAAGRSVQWMGNTGTLRKIWEGLMLEGWPPLDYGELFVVERSGDGPVTIERRPFAPW